MDTRPTLEEQLAISKLTDEECIELLTGQNNFWLRLDFWIFRHFEFLWHLIHWNWFDPMKFAETNERSVLEDELLDLTGRHELSAAEVERVYQIQEKLADIKRLEEQKRK